MFDQGSIINQTEARQRRLSRPREPVDKQIPTMNAHGRTPLALTLATVEIQIRGRLKLRVSALPPPLAGSQVTTH